MANPQLERLLQAAKADQQLLQRWPPFQAWVERPCHLWLMHIVWS
jgi:hypothetical protein